MFTFFCCYPTKTTHTYQRENDPSEVLRQRSMGSLANVENCPIKKADPSLAERRGAGRSHVEISQGSEMVPIVFHNVFDGHLLPSLPQKRDRYSTQGRLFPVNPPMAAEDKDLDINGLQQLRIKRVSSFKHPFAKSSHFFHAEQAHQDRPRPCPGVQAT